MASKRRTPPDPSDADRKEDEPIMDRRTSPDRRSGKDRREQAAARGDDRRTGKDRRKGDRRKRPARSINQYDMDDEVLEFVNAVNRFREMSGNRFPSAKEILQILKGLGYRKGS